MTNDPRKPSEQEKLDKAHDDKELDKELEQTFPASDPLTVTRTPTDKRHSDDAKVEREIKNNG